MIKKFSDYNSTKIKKGWSTDEKFRVIMNENAYLLRVSSFEKLDQKRFEFEMLQKMEAAGIWTNRPIEFGVEDDQVWMLLTWVDGEDFEEVVTQLPKDEQYKLGYEAGLLHQKIHQLPVDAPDVDWETRMNEKISRYEALYDGCPIKIEGDEKIKRFIRENRALLKDRSSVFLHGDYHVGNMIFAPDRKVLPIDLNRLDIGDAYEDFNRIVFCKDLSPHFAAGRIDGYFDGSEIPMEFWCLLALYIANNTLGSIAWAIPFGQEEIDFMLRQARGIMDDYDNFTTVVPKWYRSLEN